MKRHKDIIIRGVAPARPARQVPEPQREHPQIEPDKERPLEFPKRKKAEEFEIVMNG